MCPFHRKFIEAICNDIENPHRRTRKDMKEQCNAGTICLLAAKYEDFESVCRVVMNLKQNVSKGLYGNLYIAKGCKTRTIIL